MRLGLVALTTAALAASATLLFAQDDPHEAREAIMKANGKAIGELAAIAKNQKPYDEAVVTQALAALEADAKKLVDEQATLFPEGSAGEKGGDNAAAPAIWTNPEGFKAELDKFAAVTAEAVAAKPADAAAVGATVGKIGQVCSSCHEGFRIKKD